MPGFLKQADSPAKIISKVIHQPNPDSLTQTTMSANTDGAIHRSQSNTDLICQHQERMNMQIVKMSDSWYSLISEFALTKSIALWD